jgi:hypothetical protein
MLVGYNEPLTQVPGAPEDCFHVEIAIDPTWSRLDVNEKAMQPALNALYHHMVTS